MKRASKAKAQQLDLLSLLPGELVADTSDRARKGIAIRLKDAAAGAATAGAGVGAGAETEFSTATRDVVYRSRTLPQAQPDLLRVSAIRSAPPPAPAVAAPAPAVAAPEVYTGVRIVNGRVIREGRHTDSQWQFTGLAGAVPRRIYDYDPDVVLERRADLDGVVRLLPIQDTPGEALGTLEYVVVDVETTGAGYGLGHRITEVAIVRVNGAGRVLDDYTTLVNPERPIPAMITALTSISGRMVRNAPRFREIAQEVQERLSGRIFVAHNAGFDWGFLSRELQTALGLPLRGRLLCTVRMARKLVPEMPRRSLDALCWYFGVENEARHRAFGDARATATVFGRIMERVQERQIGGWNELQKLLYARAARRVRRSTPHTFDPLA